MIRLLPAAAIAFSFLVAACKGQSVESQILGTWTRNLESDEEVGTKISLVFNRDHSFIAKTQYNQIEKTSKGQWTIEGDRLTITGELPARIDSVTKSTLILSTKGSKDVPAQTTTLTKVD